MTPARDPMSDGSGDSDWNSAFLANEQEWAYAERTSDLFDPGMVYDGGSSTADFAEFEPGINLGNLTTITEADHLGPSGYTNALGSPGLST